MKKLLLSAVAALFLATGAAYSVGNWPSWLHDAMDQIVLWTVVAISIIPLHFWVKRQRWREREKTIEAPEGLLFMLLWAALLPAALLLGFLVTK